MINAFAAPGEWLKGNLHTHTTESDGLYSPQATVDLYAEAGYDFLAHTDHSCLTSYSGLNPHKMVLIPGSELAGGQGEMGQPYHLVVLGLKAAVEYDAADNIQNIVNIARQVGQMCFIAHPSWSRLTFQDLLSLEGIDGVEVYNTNCHRCCGTGEAAIQWDELLARGRRLWGLAVDDAHWRFTDGLLGWVMVKSPQRTPQAILEALLQGHFYASNGPSIHDIKIVDSEVQVTCDPVREVRLVGPRPAQGVTTYRLNLEGPFTEVSLPLADSWEVVRVEIVNDAGQMAWSNPCYRPA